MITRKDKLVQIQQSSVRLGARTIDFEIRRSRRRVRTVEITVTPGGVRVYAPADTPIYQLHEFVVDRGAWILERLAQARAPGNHGVQEGQLMPLLGRALLVRYQEKDLAGPSIRLEEDGFTVEVPRYLDDRERTHGITQAFVSWYNARAWERVPERVDHWWPLLGRGTKSRVLIRDQRRRWGSCAHDGTLRFNWRVVMLAPPLIDYVVVHELTHLTIKGHSPEFHRRVADALPNARDYARSLKEEGADLPLWEP